MRIIIDGTVGCGKTSVILGESQRDSEHKRFLGLADLGYPVFTDLVINVIKHMRIVVLTIQVRIGTFFSR